MMGGRGGKRKRMRESFKLQASRSKGPERQGLEAGGRGLVQTPAPGSQTLNEKCTAYRLSGVGVCFTNQTRRPADCRGCMHFRR